MQRNDENKAKKEHEALLKKLHIPKNKHAENVRVYAASAYFTPLQLSNESKIHPGSLLRTLTNVLAVVTGGDRMYESQDKTISSLGNTRALKEVPDGDPQLLSPHERMLARKKIIISESLAFQKGGYPKTAPPTPLKVPHPVIISTRAAPQFEMDYLEYKHFIVDPIQNAQALRGGVFTQRYQQSTSVPTYEEAKLQLNGKNETKDWLRLKVNDQYLVRTNTGFGLSNDPAAALLLNKKALLKSLSEDILLELTAQNELLGEINQRERFGKKGLFKATLSGLGFFANINNNPDFSIAPQLAPLFFEAYAEVLKNNAFSNIAVIEFPTFAKGSKEAFQKAFAEQPKGIEVREKQRDVLDFTEQEQAQYHCAVSNPGDCFSLPGNEHGYDSVEAAIGNNTTLRSDQAYLTNQSVLNTKQWRGVSFQDHGVIITPVGKTKDRLKQEEALFKALRTGDVGDLNAAINLGANINWQIEPHGGTLLSMAVMAGKAGLVKALLDKGVEVDAKDHKGNTALAWAVLKGQVEMAALLIDRGANYLSADALGDTPQKMILNQLMTLGDARWAALNRKVEDKEWDAKIGVLKDMRQQYDLAVIQFKQSGLAKDKDKMIAMHRGLSNWVTVELGKLGENKTNSNKMILYQSSLAAFKFALANDNKLTGNLSPSPRSPISDTNADNKPPHPSWVKGRYS